MSDLAGLRQEYKLHSLDTADVAPDPFAQFRRWFQEAQGAQIVEPNAMTLATVDSGGQPSSRTVLLKALDDRGFTFFTSYLSRKAADLDANPRAAVTFFWKELERQVNVRGIVERTTLEENSDYFVSRPFDSRIGAHASIQSSVIPSRAWLEERFAALRARWEDGQVPCPDTWGGFRILPQSMEFWQGRPGRLHDRLRYLRQEGGGWHLERLSP